MGLDRIRQGLCDMWIMKGNLLKGTTSPNLPRLLFNRHTTAQHSSSNNTRTYTPQTNYFPHTIINQTVIKMSSNSKDNTSTLQAAVDSVTGAAQSIIGSITGSTADQAQGDAKQDKAQAEHDASHAAVKVPGATISTSGVAKDNSDRSAGSWNQTVGSAKEAMGGLVGSEVRPRRNSRSISQRSNRNVTRT